MRTTSQACNHSALAMRVDFFGALVAPSALLPGFEITVLPVNPSGGLVLDSRICY